MAELGMSVPEFYKAAGISRSLAYKLVKQGKIPVVKLGNRLIVPRKAVEELFKVQNESGR
ncbi:MAG: helix-turn-helix domain-containing protein [Firmicutes bacterium]|nr:helix-turn-helix domain-containing protein [Bacillota bacterium]